MMGREQGGHPVLAGLTKDQFQGKFKVARERTLLAVVGLHYMLWKAMSEDDRLVEVLCVMMSLPFIYGFVCERWLREMT